MFVKFSVLLIILHASFAEFENDDWELAVVIEDKIELFESNGTQVGSIKQQFNKLKAVTFDNVRHQFVISDMDQQNDTIYTVQLSKETESAPIIEDLPDDVQGLAVDPITDILYWTDSINRTINYVHLNDSSYHPKILFAFTDESPQDITIDVCRRYLYWTNSDINKPTIERSRLDGTEREVLLDVGIHRPAGISIDYFTQRLFWADIKEGIYFSIESINLDGKEHEIVYLGTHSTPFGVAVDSQAIYWTDVNNNALWKLPKGINYPFPATIRNFTEKPRGIVVKNVQIKEIADCENLKKAILSQGHNKTIHEVFPHINDSIQQEKDVDTCFNGGIKGKENYCQCPRGYAGKGCELDLCYNYCIHGDCYTSSLGYPQCRCLKHFAGKRCEIDICEGFCLNQGVCGRGLGIQDIPTCSCLEGFSGRRCEVAEDICNVFCQKRRDDVLISEQKEIICRCIDGAANSNKSNFTALPLITNSEQFLDHFQDTAFLALSCILLVSLIAIIMLMGYVCSLRRRPRIKKRIIVNKNVTPLTYRPQPTTEQCEITIENCCNMNICETPCFEPNQLSCLQNKNDDKKKLLANMENGGEIY